MSNSATKHEKRGKPHTRKKRVLLTISLLVILITTTIIRDGSIYESMAQGGSQSESGNAVTSEETQGRYDLSEVVGEGKGSEEVAELPEKELNDKLDSLHNDSGEKNEGQEINSLYEVNLQYSCKEWNTVFETFSLQYANLGEGTLPADKECSDWMDTLLAKGLFYEPVKHTPAEGDLVFFYKEGDEEHLYAGIVATMEEENKGDELTLIVNGSEDQEEVVKESIIIAGCGVIPTVNVEDASTPNSGDVEPIEEPSIEPKQDEKESTTSPDIKVKAKSENAAVQSYALSGVLEQAPSTELLKAPSPKPGTITTVDTRSEEVILNLFDYGPDSLDSRDANTNTVQHPKNEGINTDEKGNLRELQFLAHSSIWNYSGNDINQYKGTNARTGIVKSQLVNGYPVINSSRASSLDYLFDVNKSTVPGSKTVYKDVNHLFKEVNGYYVFNSDDNYAYYNTNGNDTRDFKVYDGSYKTESSYWESERPIGFFPFNDFNSNEQDVTPGEYYNHFFGMTMEFDFLLTQDKKVDNEHMIFKFTGDDDVWVYIDNYLVLDLGGIHQAVTGTIDFYNGTVEANGTTRYLRDLIPGYDGKGLSKHHLNFFYLERGSTYSNCMIKYNLLSGVRLTKKITSETQDEHMNDSFAFQVQTSSSENGKYRVNKDVSVYDTRTGKKLDTNNGVFSIKANQTVVIYGIKKGDYYKIVESGINGEVYQGVIINSGSEKGVSKKDNQSVKSDSYQMGTSAAFTFNNLRREKYKDIIIEKIWKNSDGSIKTENLPEEITVNICTSKNGGTATNFTSVTLSESNEWKTTLHLPVLIDMDNYQYGVSETKVNGYTCTGNSSTTINGNTITFTLINTEEEMSLTVQKEWYKPDGNEKTSELPESIYVQLFRSTTKASSKPIDSKLVGGKTIELSPANPAWAHTWSDTDTDMEAYDVNGNPYYYYVEEVSDLSDYEVEYSGNGVSVTDPTKGVTIKIKNTYKFVENIEFPAAGGSGTIVYTAIGTILVGFSMFLLFAVTNRRKTK